MGLPLLVLGFSLLLSGRKGTVIVDGTWLRVAGRGGGRWSIGSVKSIKIDHGLQVNGRIVAALNGLNSAEKTWIVQWVQEHMRVRREDMGLIEPETASQPPPALEALRGVVEPDSTP